MINHHHKNDTSSDFLVSYVFDPPFFVGNVCFMYPRNNRFDWHPEQVWRHLQKWKRPEVKIQQLFPVNQLLSNKCWHYVIAITVSFLNTNLLLPCQWSTNLKKKNLLWMLNLYRLARCPKYLRMLLSRSIH